MTTELRVVFYGLVGSNRHKAESAYESLVQYAKEDPPNPGTVIELSSNVGGEFCVAIEWPGSQWQDDAASRWYSRALEQTGAPVGSDTFFIPRGEYEAQCACVRREEFSRRFSLTEEAGPDDHTLHDAASQGDIDAAHILIVGGAELDELNTEGFTPLHLAARAGHADVVELLLEEGADAKITCDAWTAAGLARANGHEEIYRLIAPHQD